MQYIIRNHKTTFNGDFYEIRHNYSFANRCAYADRIGGTAHEQQIKNPFACSSLQGMLLTQLDLSEEQADSVRTIFADEREVMSLLFARHGLEYQDMQQLRREMKIFRTQSPEKLSAVLNQKQRVILRRETIAWNLTKV